MQFGSTIATACLTFVLTNIDDAFVLVTFFAESSTSKNLTSSKITLGQYLGFTVIVIISLVGFAVSRAIPSQPIGFLGLLPLLLGVWRLFGLLFPCKDGAGEEETESKRIADARSIFKVASITVMNGGDNIGTYVPLFSQANGAEIAVYVVVYYILLGIWCLGAFLVMRQKHILRLAEKYAAYIIPFLYMGLGIYIIVKSSCYPWSIAEINKHLLDEPGLTVMGIVTAFLLSFVMGCMVWVKMRRQSQTPAGHGDVSLIDATQAVTNSEVAAVPVHQSGHGKCSEITCITESNSGAQGTDKLPLPVEDMSNNELKEGQNKPSL